MARRIGLVLSTDFLLQIREAFHRIAKENASRFQIVDASASREEVFEEALRLITAHCLPANHRC